LEQLSLLATGKRTPAARLTRNSKLFKTIIHAIHSKKGENIVSLDLRKIPEAVSDYFIICEATSTTQVKAIADAVEHEVKEACGETVFKQEGRQALQWVLIDFVNVVVHVMLPDARKFYKLEEMWSDAGALEHKD
jgi:ribosome-associated protein